MSPPWREFAMVLWLAVIPSAARGDDFDRLEGTEMLAALRDPATPSHKALRFRELEALPVVLRSPRSAVLLMQTDQGNVAKLMLSPGFRKAEGAGAKLVPVLLVERFEVRDGSKPGTRLARGRGIVLFPDFQFDLDTGQIVPEGWGADLQFTGHGTDDGTIQPVGTARLSSLPKPAPFPGPAPGAPAGDHIVRPGDFAGRYRLVANGQWSGLLNLKVDAAGALAGTYASDESGKEYPVSGTVNGEAPGQAQFTIAFPRAQQEFHGILWSEGKHVIAGTMTMLNRAYSFLAVREGTTLNLAPAQEGP